MMDVETAVSLRHYRRWLLLILLTAVFLRLYAITDAPPGLTHDEADHGLTAWQIVNGLRGVYFTIGYGREPLYDYATAGLMALIGPTYLAGRVTAVYFSLIMIAGMAAWVRRAFDGPTALLTTAGLAVGFWPVMAGRQMLRSITLPALFVLAVLFWWRGVQRLEARDWRLETKRSLVSSLQSPVLQFVLAGLFLGMTFYTYIPSRILWAVFPALLVYAAWRQRSWLRRAWWGVVIMLAVSALVGWPLFSYLAAHPGAEVRIDELRAPLTAVTHGNFQPLLKNTLASLRLFTMEGDSTWRYNIPGRPFLQPIMGGLFYVGLLLAVVRVWGGNQRVARAGAMALLWFLAGLAPVLVTGPDLSMTQAIGMQPILYLFPALTLVTVGRLISLFSNKNRSPGHPFTHSSLQIILVLLLFAATAVTTCRAYFITWANAPEVRVQYETTMVTAMDYLNEYGGGDTPALSKVEVAVSTIAPHAAHSPAIAQLTVHNDAVNLHWFDGRYSLLLPAADDSTIIFPGFTPLPAQLAGYFGTAVHTASLPLQPTDEDRPLDIYRVDGAAMRADWREQFTAVGPVEFGGAVTLLGYDVAATAVAPGELVQVATLWQAERPLDGAVLFTHLLGPDGVPIAQADRLDVPSESWQADDWFIQLHEFVVPEATAVGDYPLTVGIYTCPGGVPCSEGQRLPTAAATTTVPLTNLSIQ